MTGTQLGQGKPTVNKSKKRGVSVAVELCNSASTVGVGCGGFSEKVQSVLQFVCLDVMSRTSYFV